MIRLGLIGAGRWGQNYIKTIAGLPGVELAGIATRHQGNWRDLLALDGVIIATPPVSHYNILRAALEAGTPALVEKPLVLDLGQAIELQALQRRCSVPVLVDHIYLFNSAYEQLRHRATGIQTITSIGGNQGPFRPDYSALWDYGPHDVAQCLDLMRAEPATVTCQPIGDNYQLQLRWPDGTTATSELGNRMSEKRRRLVVRCAAGELIFDDCAAQKLTLNGAPVPTEAASPLARVVMVFAGAIAGRPDARLGLDLAVGVTRVLALAQQQVCS